MPKPVLQAMVLADHVYQDKVTGKHIVAGTFTRFLFKPSPQRDTASKEIAQRVSEEPTDEAKIERLVGPYTQAGTPYLYLALVEIHGEIPLELKFVDLSDASVILEAHMTVASKDPLSIAEFSVPMPRRIFVQKAGTYSLDLLYDSEILGSWRIVAAEIPTMTGDE